MAWTTRMSTKQYTKTYRNKIATKSPNSSRHRSKCMSVQDDYYKQTIQGIKRSKSKALNRWWDNTKLVWWLCSIGILARILAGTLALAAVSVTFESVCQHLSDSQQNELNRVKMPMTTMALDKSGSSIKQAVQQWDAIRWYDLDEKVWATPTSPQQD